MKKILIFLFIAITTASLAQNNDLVQEVNYCGRNFDVRNECPTNSVSELLCDEYQIQWIYIPDGWLSNVYNNTLAGLEEQLNIIEKKEIKLKSLRKKLSGHLLTYRTDSGKVKYRIIANGKVKKFSLILNLGLNEEPVNNQSLPHFVKNIVELIE